LTKARLTKAQGIDPDEIEAMLGNILLPGSMADFTDALTKRSRNVMRLRRGVSTDGLPFATDPIDWYELGRRPADDAIRPSRFLCYTAGDYYVQDAGSLLALAAAGADSDSLQGKLVCDLCAAPGGKATALLEAIGDSGFVLANEVIGSRVGPLQLNLARTGSDRYAVSSQDPDKLADRLGGTFDLVVVDAPCSGQAMVGRGKQKAASLTAKQIGHSAIRQNRILDAAVRLVRPGGQLVYSTCTFAEAENESQMTRLIQSGVASANPIDRLSEYQTNESCYRLWPHQHDCAGAFAASLIVQQSEATRERRFSRRKQDKVPNVLSSWYKELTDQTRTCLSDSIIYGWPIDAPEWVDDLAVAGPELAHRVGQTWKPSHAAALRRVSRGMSIQSCEVDIQQAQQFMRGEAISQAATPHAAISYEGDGWHVVRLAGRPLGWVKTSSSVGKNHLPKSARMQGELIA